MVAPGSIPRPGALVAAAGLAALLLAAAPSSAASQAMLSAGSGTSGGNGTGSLAVTSADEPAQADTLIGEGHEAQPAAPVRPRRTLSFTPHRLDRCAYFVVTETSGSRVSVTTVDKMDEYLFTDGIGLMKNLDQRWAVGGGVDLHLARGQVVAAPTVRCRRWFAGEQSVEASLGYVFAPRPNEMGYAPAQLVGPIVSARYSPTPGLFVQGGVCRLREGRYDYDQLTRTFTYLQQERTRAFGGVGLGGGAGAVLWGVELVTLGVLIAMFAGMD